MPFDAANLRLERFQAELAYHAAYNFWNLSGVLAERWAHGPIFGAASRDEQQVTLRPPITPGTDARLWGVYGLRASGLNAEGAHWVPQAPGLAERWLNDALVALTPKRVVRSNVHLMVLLPVGNVVEASKRLRAKHNQPNALEKLLPASLRDQVDRFHSAIDFIVSFDDLGSGVSVIAGALGPPHRGTFFVEADDERDGQWWMGLRYDRRRIEEEGLHEPSAVLRKMIRRSLDDVEYLAEAIFGGVIE